jgi:hypothetical protein
VWELLEQQATALRRGAAEEADHVEAEIVSREVETELRRLVVPIDREDLHGLSSALQRATALTRRSYRAVALLGPEAGADPTRRLEELLVRCTGTVDAAVGHLRRREYARVLDVSHELRGLQREAGIAHDEALACLLSHDHSHEAHVILCTKVPLDDLVVAIGECGALGRLFAFLAVKNG